MFVAASSARLLRAAWLLTGDAGRAEDLLQSALAKAWRRWRTVSVNNPEAYVRRILYTTYVSGWRRRWRTEVAAPPPAELAGHGDVAEEAADRDAVRRALARLSRQQRAVLVLRYAEDMSVAETATVLGCSEATVKTQASRALAAMRADPQLQIYRAGEVTA